MKAVIAEPAKTKKILESAGIEIKQPFVYKGQQVEVDTKSGLYRFNSYGLDDNKMETVTPVLKATAKEIKQEIDNELKELTQCKQTIKEGHKVFLAVCEAITTIRTKKLYRYEGYRRFDEYCKKELNISEAYAGNLIAAFQVENNLSLELGRPVINNESQARKFRKLDSEDQEKVKHALVEGFTVTEALKSVGPSKPPMPEKTTPDEIKEHADELAMLLETLKEEEKETASQYVERIVTWALNYAEEKANRAKKTVGKKGALNKLADLSTPVESTVTE
jgi:hypothetical protein